MKSVAEANVGDTLYDPAQAKVEVFPGFERMTPTVYAGLFPVDQEDFNALENALERLRLNDPSVTVTPDKSTALGLGWKLGFLGTLHMEVKVFLHR